MKSVSRLRKLGIAAPGIVVALGAMLFGAQTALASNPSLILTVSGHNVNLTGAGYTPSGQVRVELFYEGINGNHQNIVDQMDISDGNSSPDQQVCFGFPFQHCIGDPGGKINLSFPMSQLAYDVAHDPYTQFPGDSVNPCASTTTVNFLATDMTVFNAGDNVDSESGFTQRIHLNCIISVTHPPTRHHPHHHK